MTQLPAPATVDPQQRKFGRLYAADPGDLNYPMERALRSMTRAELKRVTQAWRKGPTLDQGDTSRCTQYAAAAVLGAAPFMHNKDPLGVTQKKLPDLVTGIVYENAYAWAQAYDEFDGDESTGVYGSSGRAVMNYLRETGAISGYVWATDVAVAKDYISRAGGTPLYGGSDWHASMDSPNAKGIIETLDGGVLGGHQFCVLWFDKKKGLWKCQNSWGSNWGLDGLFYLPDALFQYLIWQANGDLASMMEVRI